MGSISYKPFLSADIAHDFYESGKSADFVIAPTAFTQEKMRNEKMVFRALPTSFRVFYRAVSKADANPFTDVTDGVYSFAMRLKNPQFFLNVTNLKDGSLKYQTGNIIYFKNTNTSTNGLAYELLNRLLPAQYTYDFALTASISDDVRLRVKDSSDTNIIYTSPDPLVAVNTNAYRDAIDLRNFPPGKYLIVPVKNGTEQTSLKEKVYIDSSLAGKDVFGIIDIEMKTTNVFDFIDFTQLNSFSAGFIRRTTKWKYYVVNKTKREIVNANVGPGSPSPTIADSNPTAVVYGSTPFSGPAAASDINGFTAVSFLSDNLIPFYEVPKTGIQLIRTSDSGVIMSDLPNPTRQASADESEDVTPIYVFI